LRELLRLESVSGHQAERPEEPSLLTVEEDLEVQSRSAERLGPGFLEDRWRVPSFTIES
jgi:hypothetical protein